MSHAFSLVGKVTNPFELCIDGDLLALIEKILAEQGPDSAQISKAKGHADESMVRDGRVRMLDKIGKDLADRAADFGRRRVPPAIIDSKRMVHSACIAWDSLILDLHRIFIAIAGEAVNRDGRGGTSIHPSVWSVGRDPERRRVLQAVREFAWVPGSPGLWDASTVACYRGRFGVLAVFLAFEPLIIVEKCERLGFERIVPFRQRAKTLNISVGCSL